MQSILKVLLFILGISAIHSCSDTDTEVDLSFLIGEWKQDGKERYEVWELTNEGDLNGYSYGITDGQKNIWETLSITKEGRQIIYRATVSSQNEGATIPFYLNIHIKDHLSFENDSHDFPKKIKYKQVEADKIEVAVSGDANKGFSYIQIRQ